MNTERPAPQSRPQPLERSDFKAFRDLQTRWMDVDIYGHVNNVQYLSFFDTAVNGWYIDNGLLDPVGGGDIFLVAETGCHYFAELKFPQPVTAGLRIRKNRHKLSCLQGRSVFWKGTRQRGSWSFRAYSRRAPFPAPNRDPGRKTPVPAELVCGLKWP